MPKPQDLPESLQKFSFYNAATVEFGSRLHQHADRLIRSVDHLVSIKKKEQGKVGKTISKKWISVGVLGTIAVIAVVSALSFQYFHQGNSPPVSYKPPAALATNTPPASYKAPADLATKAPPASHQAPAGVATNNEARVALVIGNANYPDASTSISSITEDARSLGQEFRRNGFEVDLRQNVGKTDMQWAIEALTGKISSGSTVLFYFAGYGIQVARQTYLMPTNANVWTEADVRRDGINLEELVAGFHRKGAKVKIVIIDAARRNPFERRFRISAAGLVALQAPENTLAMFSAALGRLIVERTLKIAFLPVSCSKNCGFPT